MDDHPGIPGLFFGLGDGPVNRLLPLQIEDIENRRSRIPKQGAIGCQRPSDYLPAVAVFAEISFTGLTEEERADLSLIEAVFPSIGPAISTVECKDVALPKVGMQAQKYVKSEEPRSWMIQRRSADCLSINPCRQDFWARPPATLPEPFGAGSFQSNRGAAYRAAWNLHHSETWGSLKPRLLRIIAAERALTSYPWPGPVGTFRHAWRDVAYPPFHANVISGKIRNEEEARFQISLLFRDKWNEIAGRVQDLMENKAESKARVEIVKAIATFAFGGVLGLIGAPLVIQQIMSAGLDIASLAQRQQAAASMVELSEKMRESNSAFAEEIYRAAMIFHAQAAAEAKALEEAVKEVIPAKSEAVAVAVETLKEASEEEPAPSGKLLGIPLWGWGAGAAAYFFLSKKTSRRK